jgi:hypothetical protein
MSGYEAQPGGKIATALESLADADRRHHRGRDLWLNPLNTHQLSFSISSVTVSMRSSRQHQSS